MRLFVVATASVIALVAIAVALMRLGATVTHLRKLDVSLPPAVTATAPAAMVAEGAPAEEPAPVASRGDEHIRRWLVEGRELQRAAEQLLQDPDPQVRAEAQQLLRDLGAAGEASAEP